MLWLRLGRRTSETPGHPNGEKVTQIDWLSGVAGTHPINRRDDPTVSINRSGEAQYPAVAKSAGRRGAQLSGSREMRISTLHEKRQFGWCGADDQSDDNVEKQLFFAA